MCAGIHIVLEIISQGQLPLNYVSAESIAAHNPWASTDAFSNFSNHRPLGASEKCLMVLFHICLTMVIIVDIVLWTVLYPAAVQAGMGDSIVNFTRFLTVENSFSSDVNLFLYQH